MNGKFFDLKKDKQDRMINGALKVFAQNGYRHASTDEIVREAGISKGLLFHYFTNKAGVYRFVYDYSVRYMTLELSTRVSSIETDLFEVMKQIQTARINALKGYPYMQEFLNRAAFEDVSEILVIIEEKQEILEQAYEKIGQRIHFEALPAGVDGRRIYKLMEYAADGIMEEHFREGSFQADMVLEEILGYIDLMKRLVLGA